MSHKLIQKCDGCGVECAYNADTGEPPPDSPRWSNLNVASVIDVRFDLCEACTLRVADFLKLEMPDPSKFSGQLVPGLGGYAPLGGLVPSGKFVRVGQAHVRQIPMSPLSPHLGGGIGVAGSGGIVRSSRLVSDVEIDPSMFAGMTPAPGVDTATGIFTCPKCTAQRDCQSLNPVCVACGYQDPDPKYFGA